MDNNRFKMFLGITLIVVILAGISFYIFKQLSDSNVDFNDYIPAQEISDEQIRRTFVKLYFLGVESQQLQAENREIDAKELLSNPYMKLTNLLISGPNAKGFTTLIPNETKINAASLNGNTVLLDLSYHFISNVSDVFTASNMVYSIVNTLTELTEVTSVRFLIDGNGNAKFENCDFSLAEPFVRK